MQSKRPRGSVSLERYQRVRPVSPTMPFNTERISMLTRLAGARVYFSIGVPFEEALLSRIERSFEDVTIVDTRAGIERA